MVLVTLVLISAVAFAYYGRETLFGFRPEDEFERFGIPSLRRFVGSMQLLGAAGLLVGLRITAIGASAAGGLALMMMLGLIVRLRLHDPPRLMIPAATLAAINAALVAIFLTR